MNRIPLRALLLTVGAAGLVAAPVPAAAGPDRHVAIDVRPGSARNRIPLDARGAVTVAVLASATFDPSTVDASTVRFGRGAARPRNGPGRLRDTDGDGLRDLVLQFRIRDTALRPGDRWARLSGRTADGLRFGGADSVTPVRGSDRSLVLEFAGTDADQDGGEGVDEAASTASFDDTVPGAVAGTLTVASGDGTLGDFEPAVDTILSTDSPDAMDGAFHFRSIRIPAGVTVRITGSRPAILHSVVSILVEGTLDASGSPGAPTEPHILGIPSIDNALPGAAGGAGGPGGGAGGDSYAGDSLTERGGAGEDGPRGGGTGGTGGGQTDPTNASFNYGGGGGGGGHRTAGTNGANGTYPYNLAWNGPGGPGGAAGGLVASSAATSTGVYFASTAPGGAGGGAGGNTVYYPGANAMRQGAGGGGGGGGAILLVSARDVVVRGRVLARGGDGGADCAYLDSGGAGGGGSGGTLAIYAAGRVDLSGGTLDASGGRGGPAYIQGWQGGGGAGGAGGIRLEDSDGAVDTAAAAKVLPVASTGPFLPTAHPTDPPSTFVSGWFAMGSGATRLLPFQASDFSETVPAGTSVKHEIQMADEDAGNPGHADVSAIDPATGNSSDADRASGWVVVKDPVLGILDPTAALNGRGYAFLRVRITFTLDEGRGPDDPMPSVQRLRIPLEP